MDENKVIFVGLPQIHEALADMFQDWDFQTPVNNLAELEADLQAPEDTANLSKDSSMIMIFSRLFDEDPELFATIVAYYAPHVAITILMPEEDEGNKMHMQNVIRVKQVEFEENEQIATSANTPYYFVSYSEPKADTMDALDKYTRSPYINQASKDSVKSLLPDFLVEQDESAFEEYDDTPDSDLREELILEANNKGGQVIAVTSSKGGAGKSTVAIVLAHDIRKGSEVSVELGLEEEPLKVILVDFDIRDGQLGFLTGGMSPNALDILKKADGGSLTPEVVKAGIHHKPELGVDFIYATRKARTAKNIPPAFYAELITQLKTMYDIIILDTSVNYLDDLLEKVAYPVSNSILFVTDMGISSIFGMTRWVNEVTTPRDRGGSELDKNKISVVVNKTMDDVNMPAQRIQKAASGLPILAFLPSAPNLFTYAANTNSLERVLENPQVNNAFYGLAQKVVSPLGYSLGKTPDENGN